MDPEPGVGEAVHEFDYRISNPVDLMQQDHRLPAFGTGGVHAM
jgi:hypothetical protein